MKGGTNGNSVETEKGSRGKNRMVEDSLKTGKRKQRYRKGRDAEGT